VPAVPKPRKPIRDKKYLAYIREQPCIVLRCNRQSQPHHVRWGDVPGGGMSGTPDDIRTIPVCAYHHGPVQRYEILSKEIIFQVGWDLLIDWVVARYRAEA